MRATASITTSQCPEAARLRKTITSSCAAIKYDGLMDFGGLLLLARGKHIFIRTFKNSFPNDCISSYIGATYEQATEEYNISVAVVNRFDNQNCYRSE